MHTLFKRAARSPGTTLRPQVVLKALRAAATARSTSLAPALATLSSTSPVAGLTVSKVVPSRASTCEGHRLILSQPGTPRATLFGRPLLAAAPHEISWVPTYPLVVNEALGGGLGLAAGEKADSGHASCCGLVEWLS